jgi:hypothetical protein
VPRRAADSRCGGAGAVPVLLQWREDRRKARCAAADRGHDVRWGAQFLLDDIRSNPVFRRLTARRRRVPVLFLLIMMCAITPLLAVGINVQSFSMGTNETIVLVSLGSAAFLLISPLITCILTALNTVQDTNSEAYTLQRLSNLSASTLIEAYFWAAVIQAGWWWVFVGGIVSIFCFELLTLASQRCGPHIVCSLPNLGISWVVTSIALVIVVCGMQWLAILLAVNEGLSSHSMARSVSRSLTVMLEILIIFGGVVACGILATITTPFFDLWFLGFWLTLLSVYILVLIKRTQKEILFSLRTKMNETG